MNKGGKRPNAGRKKGSTNKDIDNIRNILEPYREELIKLAVKMAREGNATVLNKLMDKLLPNLNSIDMDSGKFALPEIVINVRSNTATT